MPEADDDARLMLAFAAGDGAAFDALFRRWAAPLLRYLTQLLRDAATAEELVQESFLRVHRAQERYAPQARFSTWLYRIATNLARNELRRPLRRHPHWSRDAQDAPELPEPAGEPAEQRIDSQRAAASLEQALRELPERQRAALLLVAVEGLSYAEVAEALEVTQAAVKSLVHRARAALAQRLRRGESQ